MARRSIVALLGEESSQYLACALVETQHGQMIVPDVAIAEVMGWQRHGQDLVWRDHSLPSLNLSQDQQRMCVLICHAIHFAEQDFFAICVTQLPKIRRLKVEDIEPLDAQLAYPWQRSWVMIDRKRTILPDLELLEKAVFKSE